MSKKTFNGKIVSNKMNKTVSVLVETVKSHNLYDKKVKSSKKFLSHCELETYLGDMVQIIECKPYSKNVKFEVVNLIKKEN